MIRHLRSVNTLIIRPNNDISNTDVGQTSRQCTNAVKPSISVNNRKMTSDRRHKSDQIMTSQLTSGRHGANCPKMVRIMTLGRSDFPT